MDMSDWCQECGGSGENVFTWRIFLKNVFFVVDQGWIKIMVIIMNNNYTEGSNALSCVRNSNESLKEFLT